jgi:hypothetical protein
MDHQGGIVLHAFNCFVVQTDAVGDLHVLWGPAFEFGWLYCSVSHFVARGNAEGVNNKVDGYHLKLRHFSKQHLM